MQQEEGEEEEDEEEEGEAEPETDDAQEKNQVELAEEVGAFEPQEQKLEVLRITTSNRDDWLHRGTLLMDLTWDCYVQYFERVHKPRDVWRIKDGGAFYPFAQHYVTAKVRATYCICGCVFGSMSEWDLRVLPTQAPVPVLPSMLLRRDHQGTHLF